MSFTSYSFVALFALTLVARLTIGRNKVRVSYLIFLLVASLVFYASYYPPYLLILIAVTFTDYYLGNRIYETPDRGTKKALLTVSIVSNLALLGCFKYFNFFMECAGYILGRAGYQGSLNFRLDWLLPLGISFFTFQSMSYTIDVYRGTIRPVASYWRFLLFVTFFTHLVAGPIVRAREFVYQFARKRRPRLVVFLHGLYLLILGFFLKMVVADNAAYYVNRYWAQGAAAEGAAVPIVLMMLFAAQLFSDFAGYSYIAIGGAYLLGFKLPQNFNCPYIAASLRDFWSRWHITLSFWIRDYLFLPLVGARGSALKVFNSLLFVMIVVGLWHGAALTFIIWGALHGVFLALERMLGFHRMGPGRPLAMRIGWFGMVQVMICLSGVFFRSENTNQALAFLGNVFSWNLNLDGASKLIPGLAFTIPVFLIHIRGFLSEGKWVPTPGFVEKGLLSGIMFYCLLSMYGTKNAFIYFQF